MSNEQQVFDSYGSVNKLLSAGKIADEAARVCIDSGDLDAASKWYKIGHDTGLKEPDIKPARQDLWNFRWEYAQAGIAARRGDHQGFMMLRRLEDRIRKLCAKAVETNKRRAKTLNRAGLDPYIRRRKRLSVTVKPIGRNEPKRIGTPNTTAKPGRKYATRASFYP